MTAPGPEDPLSNGPQVYLTAGQYDQLHRFVGRKRGTVRLRDIGAAYVIAEMLDAEGKVSTDQLLFPIDAVDSPASKRQHTRKLKADFEAELKAEADAKAEEER